MESSLTNACTIKIPDFEGPFDLLFHLMEKNKVSIYDIPINEIADQYLKYLFDMQHLNLEIASEFLVMAATLLYIKSRMLLPGKELGEEEGPDPREDLVTKLMEYRKYKEAAETLKENGQYWSKSFVKMSGECLEPLVEPPIEISSDQLMNLYNELVLKNARKENRNLTRIEDFVIRERVSVRIKMKQILKYFTGKSSMLFEDVFSLNRNTRPEVVAGFMAMLELTRLRKLVIEQKRIFSSILMKKRREGDDNGN